MTPEHPSQRSWPKLVRSLWFYALVSIGLLVYVLAAPDSPEANGVVLATYAEECQAEGCADEEVYELHHLYAEECLNEGCAKEEVFETGGGANGASAMRGHFASLGLNFNPADFQGICPFCGGTTTECYGVVLVCDDNCTYPDGSTSSPYACGGCLGLDV